MTDPTMIDSCKDCTLFREKYKGMKMEKTKTKTPIPIAVLEGLPRNADGSINYEDVLFAYNARKAMGIKD